MCVLSDNGVKVAAVHVPPVDPETAEGLLAHMVARDRGLQILENLALSLMEPRDYELIALPMKLEGLDAASVRDILRPLQETHTGKWRCKKNSRGDGEEHTCLSLTGS